MMSEGFCILVASLVIRPDLLVAAERKGSKSYIEQGISTGSMTFAVECGLFGNPERPSG
jgi:hypothetical protein